MSSAIKSAVIVGLLFVTGLVVISFINFLAFSPATPNILATTEQYKGASVLLTDVYRIRCSDGSSSCSYEHPIVTLSVKNNWTKIHYRLIFVNDHNDDINGNGLSCIGWPIGPTIKTGEGFKLNCTEKAKWDSQRRSYHVDDYWKTTRPFSVCVEFSEDIFQNGSYKEQRDLDTSLHKVCVKITDTSPR